MALTRAMKWRRFRRRVFGPWNPYIGDLRLIQIEHRWRYRERMNRDLGHALNALYNAYFSGHLVSQRARLSTQQRID